MNPKKENSILVVGIVLLSAIASTVGILSAGEVNVQQFVSIHGRTINIYGKGIYKYMSADVAIQGIAQDYVTLFVGVPLLLIGLFFYRRGSLRACFVLSGTLGYFFVTYLFYTAMGMYNELFLVYTALLGLSFFALLVTLFSVKYNSIDDCFSSSTPIKTVGLFLITNSILIGMMWLSVIIPPLLDKTVYPEALQHYTTLIVQGFDLGLLLPLSFISGLLLLQKKNVGYLAATTYIIFISLLMTALTAKVIAMMLNNVEVIPAIFIIPTLNIIAIILSFSIIKSIEIPSLGSQNSPKPIEL